MAENVYQEHNNEFKEYLNTHLDKSVEEAKKVALDRESFQQCWPLERIKTLPCEEYVQGAGRKDTLSYDIEFGKFRGVIGIGGGSAYKFGIYVSKKDGEYHLKDKKIDNIDELWPQFRSQLYDFLVSSKDRAVVISDYPLLQGMGSVLTKLCHLYYPDKYLSSLKMEFLRWAMDFFGYEYSKEMKNNEISFLLNQKIREDFPVLNEYEDWIAGTELWQFYNEKVESDKNSSPDPDVQEKRIWIYSPGDNAEKWEEFYSKGVVGIGWGSIGNLSTYESREEMRLAMKEQFDPSKSYKVDSLATWEFVHVMQPGDIIIVKQGRKKVIGRGIVTGEYYYDDTDPRFSNFRKMDWTDKGEWEHPGQAAIKTLTDITRYTEYVEQLKSLFENDLSEEEEEKEYPPYDETDFLNEVYMDEDSYYTLVDLIREKKNVILQGAPGVGKTFVAKRLAYSIIGSKNQEQVMMIQFHQSYSYEDFIEGFRPSTTGLNFDIKKGAFLEFCDRARDDLENDYFFIIDEINRGNLSKIFGELFMLIENDKRGNELQLLYSGDRFSVPRNVYILGMMNTADRSLALLDYALRRRFAFFEMTPGFNTEGFKQYRDALNEPKFNQLIQCVQRLNEQIKEDDFLGEGFCIGHSFFCDKKNITEKELSNIVEYELIPLLKEYWFDDQSKVIEWSENLRRAIQ